MGQRRRRVEQEPVVVQNVYCKHETEKALLIAVSGFDDMWVPKSQVHGCGLPMHNDAQVFDDLANSEGSIVLSAWIAGEKGLDGTESPVDAATMQTAFDAWNGPGDDDIPF